MTLEKREDCLIITSLPVEQMALLTLGLALDEEARTVLGDDKGGVLQTQYSEYLSRGNIIRQSSLPEYNEDARAAQKKLSGFPASLLAKLAGLSADVIS